ncbi:MAG: PDZ domain-containing protein [Gemmatimonadetes bacterium]|nr:PDZ domain-containing protein [Gemmatimonadota bacterium]
MLSKMAPLVFALTLGLSGDDPRACLGVRVQTSWNPKTDSVGALIQDVLPDGPAAKAGVREGDVVARFNRVSLGVKPGDEDRTRPGRRLVELARSLEPGDTVNLEVRRDGETRSLTLVAARWSQCFPREARRELRIRVPEIPDLHFELPDLEGLWGLRGRGLLCVGLGRDGAGLLLVPLNRDLGGYFGAEEGILVVRVPDDSPLKLRAGDVILSIDGRKPRDPEHAMRILRSYEPEESVRFEVLRQKKTTSVEGKIPERLGFRWFWPRWEEDP